MAEPVRTEIIPYLFYNDVAAALTFLQRAFGFAETMRVGTPSGGIHAEVELDGRKVMLGQGGASWHMGPPGQGGTATQGVFIYLPDVDAHHARAVAAGATISQPVKDESYGRTYTAHDPEGHPWFFCTPPAA
jgi:uncharacterized glyoxalase superfamily protein PhnB